jgi:hypothetical protein
MLMESIPKRRWKPGHTCDLCWRQAAMPHPEDDGWLCATCYVLTRLIRVKHIDDPSTVQALARWLERRTVESTHTTMT